MTEASVTKDGVQLVDRSTDAKRAGIKVPVWMTTEASTWIDNCNQEFVMEYFQRQIANAKPHNRIVLTVGNMNHGIGYLVACSVFFQGEVGIFVKRAGEPDLF